MALKGIIDNIKQNRVLNILKRFENIKKIKEKENILVFHILLI